MDKLFAFGCSFTYGEGLSDCLNYKSDTGEHMPKHPSKYAYPALLGKMLGKKVVNFGRPGCSNRYIANKILDTDISKKDVVVILWTQFDRSVIFTEDYLHNRKDEYIIHPNMNTKLVRNYYKHIHNPYNSFIESVEAINLANYKLKKHSHVFNFKATSRFHATADYPYPKWNRINLIDQPLYYLDYADDNDHPGPESQKLIAENMLKYIKEKTK